MRRLLTLVLAGNYIRPHVRPARLGSLIHIYDVSMKARPYGHQIFRKLQKSK